MRNVVDVQAAETGDENDEGRTQSLGNRGVAQPAYMRQTEQVVEYMS